MGFSYIITKKYIERAEADVGLMFTAYNLRRIINILGLKAFKSNLKSIAFIFIAIIAASKHKVNHFKLSSIIILFLQSISNNPINGLIFNQILAKSRGC